MRDGRRPCVGSRDLLGLREERSEHLRQGSSGGDSGSGFVDVSVRGMARSARQGVEYGGNQGSNSAGESSEEGRSKEASLPCREWRVHDIREGRWMLTRHRPASGSSWAPPHAARLTAFRIRRSPRSTFQLPGTFLQAKHMSISLMYVMFLGGRLSR